MSQNLGYKNCLDSNFNENYFINKIIIYIMRILIAYQNTDSFCTIVRHSMLEE